jgi:hypothetical protein
LRGQEDIHNEWQKLMPSGTKSRQAEKAGRKVAEGKKWGRRQKVGQAAKSGARQI